MRKKHSTVAQGASFRRAERKRQRRAAAAARVKVRKAMRVPVPWNMDTDNCQYIGQAETYRKVATGNTMSPLDGLDSDFRKEVNWIVRPDETGPLRPFDFMVGMLRPEREHVSGASSRFVAIDPQTYRGSAVTEPAAAQEFWVHQLNGRPFSLPFLKSGLAIWKKTGIKAPADMTAYMMRMDSIDDETSEAIHSAIFSAFNTAREPIDIETATFVLASFMHADPLRKHLVPGAAYIEPYGERTRYGLVAAFPLPRDIDGGDNE